MRRDRYPFPLPSRETRCRGFLVPEFDPRGMRRDGLRLVLQIKPNEVVKFMDDETGFHAAEPAPRSGLAIGSPWNFTRYDSRPRIQTARLALMAKTTRTFIALPVPSALGEKRRDCKAFWHQRFPLLDGRRAPPSI